MDIKKLADASKLDEDDIYRLKSRLDEFIEIADKLSGLPADSETQNFAASVYLSGLREDVLSDPDKSFSLQNAPFTEDNFVVVSGKKGV
ncbi:MAG: aspartyl/glutamyl-tRNA amidotransferase subunit C [Clostridiales bacterium]|jgi:Asp-tRNA(Asn)/Glu-tRNA(Gln) amidotransferase C subunit|nr:aspartyl/glutamyl-tRNA amidotransferase subunit C [Clostridiales bacterium]